MRPVHRVLLLLLTAAASLSAEDKGIDVQRSTITVHVGKAGLFSAAGHEHWVNAPIASGSFNDSDALRVQFRVEAAKLEVKAASKADAKDQAEIQKSMQEKVLESSRYPDIVFQSASVYKVSEGQWTVNGALTLHGVMKPVSVSVKRDGDAYSGRAVIKQTDFGIRPISVGGGIIKVKNDVDITFHIVSK